MREEYIETKSLETRATKVSGVQRRLKKRNCCSFLLAHFLCTAGSLINKFPKAFLSFVLFLFLSSMSKIARFSSLFFYCFLPALFSFYLLFSFLYFFLSSMLKIARFSFFFLFFFVVSWRCLNFWFLSLTFPFGKTPNGCLLEVKRLS